MLGFGGWGADVYMGVYTGRSHRVVRRTLRDSRNANEPVAWGVVYPNGEFGILAFYRREAEDRATASDRVVPLYRSPTLTDEEREAIAVAMHRCDGPEYKALRGLLERLK